MDQKNVAFTVNGAPRSVTVPADAMLLDTLREDLGLTGAKRGCGGGECGACTVLVDGDPVASCIFPVLKAGGREITTVEGLGTQAHLHPLQGWFLRLGAVQCGFCTPGLLMSAKALLDRNRDPSEVDIREAIAGNLCRCTGYYKVVQAIQAAAAELRGETPLDRTDREGEGSLGRSLIKVDGIPKVLGTAKYGADLHMPGMLHAAMVTSPHAHARLGAIDGSAALALPGVVAVLTHMDIPGEKRYGVIKKDTPFLPFEKVRYLGEPVALVVAETEDVARRAVHAVQVEYEVLPAVFDPWEARQPGAPAVHDYGNILHHSKIRKGNIEEGFRRAQIVVSRQFVTQTMDHAYLEPEAALGYWDGEKLVVQGCSQGPHYHRNEIARMLGLPVSRVRFIQATTGGGFGGKVDLGVQHFVGLATFVTGRPVKMVWTRQESFRTSTKRHAFYLDYRFGATKTGRLVAAQAEIIANTGAYASFGPAVLTRSGTMALGPYDCPNVWVDSYAIHTNTQISGAVRGFGAPQMSPCHEPLIDAIGRECGLSPVEVRRLNMVTPGSSTVTQQVLEAGVGALPTLDAIVKELVPLEELPTARERGGTE